MEIGIFRVSNQFSLHVEGAPIAFARFKQVSLSPQDTREQFVEVFFDLIIVGYVRIQNLQIRSSLETVSQSVASATVTGQSFGPLRTVS